MFSGGPLGGVELHPGLSLEEWKILVRDVCNKSQWQELHRWIYYECNSAGNDIDRLWMAAQWVAYYYAVEKHEEGERLQARPSLVKEAAVWQELTDKAEHHLDELRKVLTDSVFKKDLNDISKSLRPVVRFVDMLKYQNPDYLLDPVNRGRPRRRQSDLNLTLRLHLIWCRCAPDNKGADDWKYFASLMLYAVGNKVSLGDAEGYVENGLSKALKAAKKVGDPDLPDVLRGLLSVG